MLEPPDLSPALIAANLRQTYALPAAQIAFLPLGADVSTAVYRVVAAGGRPYFLKLRRGTFDETAVLLPSWLAEHGVTNIIAPLPTSSGQLWGRVEDFTTILYPFVEGRNGYEVALSDAQWLAFGQMLRRVHDAAVPAEIRSRIQRETFTPVWRESVRSYLRRAASEAFGDPVAANMAAVLQEQHAEIADLVDRTERLAQLVQARPFAETVCHTDLHAGNFHITPSGELYVVDWDAPVLAPRERDLMYVGAGLQGGWRMPAEEQQLFYRGYGATEVDQVALAYYRYERIVQDIAAYCDQLLLSDEGGEDREQSFQYFSSNFGPRGLIALTRSVDATAI
jgi:spectinomycin phosphotransferase